MSLKKRAAPVMFLFLLGVAGAQSQKAAPAPPADPPSATAIPAVSDTMSWISGHFEKSVQTSIIPVRAEGNLSPEQRELYGSKGWDTTVDTGLTIVTTHTYSVSFQDCSVTLTQKAVNDATQKAAKEAEFQQKNDVEDDSTVVGPFDLSNLRPDKIVVEPPSTLHPSWMKTGPRLKIAAASGIPNAVTTDGQDLQDAFGMGGPSYEKIKETFNERTALALSPSKSPDTVTEITIDFATQEMADRQAKAWKAAITGCGGKAVSDKLF